MATPILELEGTWEELTRYAESFAGRRLRFVVMPIDESVSERPLQNGQTVSARELMKLPRQERDRILQARAAEAESLYRNDPELKDFEAFGEDDLFDETP